MYCLTLEGGKYVYINYICIWDSFRFYKKRKKWFVVAVMFAILAIFFFEQEGIKADCCNAFGILCDNKYEDEGEGRIEKARDYLKNKEYELALNEGLTNSLVT